MRRPGWNCTLCTLQRTHCTCRTRSSSHARPSILELEQGCRRTFCRHIYLDLDQEWSPASRYTYKCEFQVPGCSRRLYTCYINFNQRIPHNLLNLSHICCNFSLHPSSTPQCMFGIGCPSINHIHQQSGRARIPSWLHPSRWLLLWEYSPRRNWGILTHFCTWGTNLQVEYCTRRKPYFSWSNF